MDWTPCQSLCPSLHLSQRVWREGNPLHQGPKSYWPPTRPHLGKLAPQYPTSGPGQTATAIPECYLKNTTQPGCFPLRPHNSRMTKLAWENWQITKRPCIAKEIKMKLVNKYCMHSHTVKSEVKGEKTNIRGPEGVFKIKNDSERETSAVIKMYDVVVF